MSLEFATPWVLLLLPLALVPLTMSGQRPCSYPSLLLVPRDRISTLVDYVLRVLAGLTIIALIVGMSGPNRAVQIVERTGRGAHMVLLLDRSRSMDEPFFTESQNKRPAFSMPRGESKGMAARRLLTQFVDRRENDRYALVVFSTNPIEVLPFTDKTSIIQAAIAAGGIGKGLAETDFGRGLIRALEFFNNQPYTGSRIVVLVSDGAARLSMSMQRKIRYLIRRNHVALYWIYLRNQYSTGLLQTGETAANLDLAPQRVIHQFFLDADIPYRVYMAENPESLERAIADVGRLQYLPIRYQDVIPRRDLSDYAYRIALILLLIQLLAKVFEVKTWR